MNIYIHSYDNPDNPIGVAHAPVLCVSESIRDVFRGPFDIGTE